jgi:4a-hydroxytetrahydrobiopterin dehydratase
MTEMSQEKCRPCEKTDRLGVEEIKILLTKLPGWTLRENTIEREFLFKSYLSGLDFACVMGKIAERENHHPDIWIGWRRVKITLSTHAIHGLSRNDFIMGAKSELEYSRFRNISA